MSIEINHEKVAKRLALKIADLEYQVVAYNTVVEELQEQINKLENLPEAQPKEDEYNGPVPTV